MIRRNFSNGKSKNHIDPAKLGLWECCDGVWYTPGGRCPKCGRTANDPVRPVSDGVPAKLPKPKSEPDFVAALDFKFEEQKIVPRDDVRYIVVFSRGYTGLPLDYDNLVASLKALRDSVAEKILKMDTDAEAAGLQWEYRQAPGQSGTTIAIYRRKERE